MGNVQTGIGPTVLYRHGHGRERSAPSTDDPSGEWPLVDAAAALCVSGFIRGESDGGVALAWAVTNTGALPPALVRHTVRCVRRLSPPDVRAVMPLHPPVCPANASVAERALELVSVAADCTAPGALSLSLAALTARVARAPELHDAVSLVWAAVGAVGRAVRPWWGRFFADGALQDAMALLIRFAQQAAPAENVPLPRDAIEKAHSIVPGLTPYVVAAQWLRAPNIGITLRRFISAGGHGSVFEATDASGNAWAVKLIMDGTSAFQHAASEIAPFRALDAAIGQDETAARTRDRLLARVDVCLTLDACPFYISCAVMPLAVGTLELLARRGTSEHATKHECDRLLGVLADVYNAIRFINDRGNQALCDLRPENVLVYPARAPAVFAGVVADFGLNRPIGEQGRDQGHCVGTAYYISTAVDNGIATRVHRPAQGFYDIFVFAKLCVWALAHASYADAAGWITGVTAQPRDKSRLPDAVPLRYGGIEGFAAHPAAPGDMLAWRCAAEGDAGRELLWWALRVVATVNSAARRQRENGVEPWNMTLRADESRVVMTPPPLVERDDTARAEMPSRFALPSAATGAGPRSWAPQVIPEAATFSKSAAVSAGVRAALCAAVA